jgi:hypothetical protein
LAILTSRPEEFYVAGINQNRNTPSISIQGAKQNAHQQQAFASFGSVSQQQQQHEMMAAGSGFSSADVELHSVCFLDANTFECLHVLELNKQEIGLSLCTAFLGDDTFPYFAVGTSQLLPDEPESKQASGGEE